jgi:hypothetical protein
MIHAMKTKNAFLQFVAFVAVTVLTLCAIPARAQDPRDLMPAASEAKAKELLAQAIDALGGRIYLNAHSLDCHGRYGQFDGANGESEGSIEARFERVFPDISRTEMDSTSFITEIYGIPVNTHGRVIMVYGKDGAWTLGKDGVEDLGPDALADFRAQLKTDMNTFLRERLNTEPGLLLRYGGDDLVDLKEVDWVEISDSEQHDMRMAIDKKSHLPVRFSVFTRDKITNLRVDTSRTFTNYHLIGGMEVPFQSSVLINDRISTQTFYSECQANEDLSPDLFTRAGLEAEAKSKKKQK